MWVGSYTAATVRLLGSFRRGLLSLTFGIIILEAKSPYQVLLDNNLMQFTVSGNGLACH